MTKYLDEEKFYMNPVSGSVAKGDEWENDFKNCRESELWELWGGESLIEVCKKNDEWVEVK